MNLSRLFWEDKNEEQATVRSQRMQVEHELSLVDTQLSMFKVPLWEYLKDTLEQIEESATDALVSGTDEPTGVRERIRLARHLARLEGDLMAERARLEDILKEETE